MQEGTRSRRERWAPAVAGALLAAAAGLGPRPALGFDYFEHRFLGDLACASARRPDFPRCRLGPERLARSQAITFGDLVAMAGDHFATPEDMAREVARYLGAVEECSRATGFCRTLPRMPVADTLQAREVQARGVMGWLGTAGRGDRVGACLDAVGWRGERVAPQACLDLLDTQNDAVVMTPDPGAQAALAARRAPVQFDEALVASLRSSLDAPRQASESVAAAAAWAVPDALSRGDCYAGSADEFAVFGRLYGYAQLASSNAHHFGSASEREIARYLELARAPAADPLLREARLAFALHFLGDRFCSGHLRTPRARLSNGESKRRHDYDNAYGLVVASREGPKDLVWQAFGDGCLLGDGSAAMRALASRAAIEAVRRSATGVAGGELALPLVGERNPPVPPRPSLVSLSFEPGFGGVARFREHAQTRGAPTVGARWSLALHLERLWEPPELTQMAWMDGDGGQVIVPAALDPVDTAVWLGLLPWIPFADFERQVEFLGARNLLQHVAIGGLRPLNLKAGVAFARDPGRPTASVRLYVGESLLWVPFESFYVRLAFDAVLRSTRNVDLVISPVIGFDIF